MKRVVGFPTEPGIYWVANLDCGGWEIVKVILDGDKYYGGGVMYYMGNDIPASRDAGDWSEKEFFGPLDTPDN